MKPISELMGTVVRGEEMQSRTPSQQWQNNYAVPEEVNQRSAIFWQEMTGIYSDKWKAKNGRAPSLRWNQVITSLTNEQLQAAVDACVQRCCEGNQFAPDLAEFMGIVSQSVTNPFGLSAEDVMVEFDRYCKTRYQHSCAETFPWRQPVLYHICCKLRSEMLQGNLSGMALEKRAVVHLKAWGEKVKSGQLVPAPKPLLSEKPTGPRKAGDGYGHAAAMALLAKMRGSKPQTNH